ncbi:MAG: response regulator [Anaerolineaceae bacterium]|nr:response regulator [Anaerolineaceae bacterium]
MARILIADDQEIARLTLSDILRLEGHSVRMVDCGEKALDAIKEEPFDILILDLKMPGMGGMPVLRKVSEDYPNIRVILMTAYGTMDTAIEALRRRVHDYLQKPFSPDDILRSVNRAINSSWELGSEIAETQGKYVSDPLNLDTLYFHFPGGVVVDFGKHQVSMDSTSLCLTPTESRLMQTLCEDHDQVIHQDELVYKVQGYRLSQDEAAKMLRPVMCRLRRKLSKIPGGFPWIKNVRGVGYILDLEGKVAEPHG